MNTSFIEASSLAIIDHTIEGIKEHITPAQYEIIRQVIYATGDLEYQSLLKFSGNVLEQGAAALRATKPIIVDVPEIQVCIVPLLVKTFGNSVSCCTTTKTEVSVFSTATKASSGLEVLAEKYPQGIFIVGQDQTTMSTMLDLLEDKAIEPSLAIATPPTFLETKAKQRLQESSIPYICVDSKKGSATVANAIFNALVKLTWRAYPQKT